jgi:hypothetical protein
MATTPNYGWVMPDPTDFVTDLPADFEIFGDAVDATVDGIETIANAALPETIIDAAGDLIYGTADDTAARLAIGTAGQVLKVNSGATAPEWGIDPTADVVTTAGDLIYGTAADTVTRLGIGTANQVLTVNSGATAPEWTTISAGGWTQIATANLVSSSTATFTSIPGTYQQLALVVNGVRRSGQAVYAVRINNVTTSNYSQTYTISGTATNTAETSQSSVVIFDSGNLTDGTTTGNATCIFANYAQSGGRRFFTYTSVGGQNTSPQFQARHGIAKLDTNTSAITQIDLFQTTGGVLTSGTATLYGLK